MLFDMMLQFCFCLLVIMVTSVWSHGSQSTADHHGFEKDAIQDKEHMKEHLKGQIETDKPMTEEEMQFHYFKLHDYDNNSMLDGTELVKAFTHHQREDPQNGEVLSEQVLIGFIDDILKRDDINNNGYIEYPEYITGMRSRRAA